MPAGQSLAARVGIATGLVVVGELVGEGAAREEAAVSETPNLAARPQSAAEPGSVVIAASTRRLVGGLFDCLELRPPAAKGFTDPITAYRVVGPGTVEGRFDALHATLTPLVGREEEIDFLLRFWGKARSGEGQVVLLSGEPGIGKSRLLAGLQERLRDDAPVTGRCFCSPCRRESPLPPIIAYLEHAAGFARGDPAAGLQVLEEARREVARTEARAFEAELIRLEGELRPLVGDSDAAAEACLREALGVARRQEARSFELRAATSLARLWQRRGRRAAAVDLLAPLYGWFTKGCDTPDLMEAKALLDELRLSRAAGRRFGR